MQPDDPTREEIDPLTRLAIKHGTDKWGPHFYTPHYHALFAHLRDRPVRLLEIGVGGYGLKTMGGASLAMWAEYFPNGSIVGIDIAEKTLDLAPRIRLERGSQDDPVFLDRICNRHGPFDIVVDDGSHIPEQVAGSFRSLFPRLADGGFYVIEDVQTSFWPSFGGSVVEGGATMHLALNLLKSLNHAEMKIAQPDLPATDLAQTIRSFRAYHNLFVIEKGDNSEPSNFDYRADNVHAAHALSTIKTELARNPTPAGAANLIDVYNCSNNVIEAMAVAEWAVAQWPNHTQLLLAAFNAAGKSGDLVRMHPLAQRLASREPDNSQLRHMLDQQIDQVRGQTQAKARSVDA